MWKAHRASFRIICVRLNIEGVIRRISLSSPTSHAFRANVLPVEKSMWMPRFTIQARLPDIHRDLSPHIRPACSVPIILLFPIEPRYQRRRQNAMERVCLSASRLSGGRELPMPLSAYASATPSSLRYARRYFHAVWIGDGRADEILSNCRFSPSLIRKTGSSCYATDATPRCTPKVSRILRI